MIIESVTKFYGDGFDASVLNTQLKTLPFCIPSVTGNMTTFGCVLTKVKAFSNGHKILVSEIIKILKIILVMSATNAVSERSFNAMR